MHHTGINQLKHVELRRERKFIIAFLFLTGYSYADMSNSEDPEDPEYPEIEHSDESKYFC